MSQEERVAVVYSSLMYMGRVVQETADIIMVTFPERRADGCYETKKEVDKEQIIVRDVTVKWKGIGHDVPGIKTTANHQKTLPKVIHSKLLPLSQHGAIMFAWL